MGGMIGNENRLTKIQPAVNLYETIDPEIPTPLQALTI
jgi:hypothetical protein